MLYDVFDEPQYYYLVTEKMGGGELFDRIVQKSYYNEKEARDTCKIIFEAIKYCHDHNVAHRDLKPENLLLVGENDSDIKIADFGFAKVRTIDRGSESVVANAASVVVMTIKFISPFLLFSLLYVARHQAKLSHDPMWYSRVCRSRDSGRRSVRSES